MSGSLASAAYGEPRASNGMDVVAKLDDARTVAAALATHFYVDPD